MTSSRAYKGIITFYPDRTDPDCHWNLTVDADWVTLERTSGVGPGWQYFWLSENTGAKMRVAHVCSKTDCFSAYQRGSEDPCPYSLNKTGVVFGAGGGEKSVDVTFEGLDPYPCSWPPTEDCPSWVSTRLSNLGNNNYRYYLTAEENTSTQRRTATITIAHHSVSLVQEGQPCSYGMSASAVALPSKGGEVRVSLVLNEGTCGWAVSSAPDWISLSQNSGIGSDTITATAEKNPTGETRIGTIVVNGKSLTIRQEAKAKGMFRPAPVILLLND